MILSTNKMGRNNRCI